MMARVFSIISLLITLSGCSISASPDMAAISKARELVDRGVIALREGKLEEAEAAFNVVLDVAEIPEGYDGLGCVYFLLGEYDKAERFMQAALKLDPDYSRAISNLALVYEARGDQEHARLLHAIAVEYDPASARTRNNRAVLLANSSAEEAMDEFLKAKALEVNPIIEYNIGKVNNKRRGVR